jgi:uncharacterized protein YpmS
VITGSILAILAALVPTIALLIKRHLTSSDDPQTQNLANKEEADRALASGDVDGLNRLLESDLRRLQNGSSNSSGQGDQPAQSGTDLPGHE